MSTAFAAAIKAAAEATPMTHGSVPILPGRLLLADGDGLAYYCAGDEDTLPGEARQRLIQKLQAAVAACGAESVKIVTTARGSHKGHRYAVARVKPYQGQRDDGRKPKNWAYLRELLEEGFIGDYTVELTDDAEADDLFARYAASHGDCVIYTQDKDMQMIPGLHLDWKDHLLFKVESGTWAAYHNDKLWGRAWFWSQMLHGDPADNIPGLPFYTTGELLKSGPNKGQVKQIRCGPASTAVKEMLPQVSSDMGATVLLQGLYETCYGDRWLVEMLEQGILLWMRNDQTASPFNVTFKGNPLHHLTTHADYPAARAEIMARITKAMIHEETEEGGAAGSSSSPLDTAAQPVCALSASLPAGESGAGPRSLDGGRESSPAPDVQRPAGEGGEQLPPLRGDQPVGIPAWLRHVLADARV